MPLKDTMSYRSGPTTVRKTCVNVHFSVGAHNADNGQADIMLIQTLFNYIGKADTRLLGFSRQSMPVIDGKIGSQTRNAIMSFQRRHSHRLLSVDGVVHPAKYQDRVINLGGRLMTITLLDQFAFDEALMRNDGDQIAGLVKLEPRLSPWLV